MKTLVAALLIFSGCAHQPTGTDCHMHVSPDPDFGVFPHDGNSALRALDASGLRRGCILSPGYVQADGCQSLDCPAQRESTRTKNDWTLKQARENPNLIAFCGIPLTAPWAAEEALRCAAAGARGLKLHPVAAGQTLTDPKVYDSLGDVSKAAATAKLPILIHIAFTDEDVDAFFKLAAENARTTYILAHELGPKYQLLKKAPPNVYIDISGLVLAPRSAGPKFVALWRELGMHRVVLGSDWPSLHPSEYVAQLRAFPLTERERRMIIDENARRLFP